MTELAETSPAVGRRVLTAAAIYFVLVFAVGFVLGPARVFWVEPLLGPTLAVLCEAPILIVAMVYAAQLASHVAGLRTGWLGYLIMGLLALVLQQVADLAVGFGLRGVTLQEQIAYFRTLPGYIYIATLLLFAAMPLLLYWRALRIGQRNVRVEGQRDD
jgi:hypothetical protein